MKKTSLFFALATALLFSGIVQASPVPAACSSVSTNLVTNCGFETGDLTGWTTTPPGLEGQYYGVDSVDAGVGNYGAYLAGQSSGVFLSQDLHTVAGMSYYVTFYLAHPDANIPPYDNAFEASFNGGTPLYSESDDAFGFTEFTFTGTATSSLTTVEFGALDPLFFFSLDNVAVYPTPEPSTAALLLPLLLAGALVAGSRWFRGRRLAN